MPVYEFECPKCREDEEISCSYKDLKVPVCSNCGSLMIRSYSPPAIQFKGSGFYCTDNRE